MEYRLNHELTADQMKTLFGKSEKFWYVNDRVLGEIKQHYTVWEGDRLIGLIAFKDYSECTNSWRKKFTDLKSALYISELMVDPEYQRQGLGTRLVEMVKHHGIVNDYSQLVLSTDHNDNDLVHAFYKRLGFVTVGDFTYESIGLTLDIYSLNVRRRWKFAKQK